ncbi:MAG: cyclic nucleotide-binding domain-containing protein [Planctomycetota bacterium]
MNTWLHLSNILYLLSYSVRDILWLRILTVIAILSMMPYYYCCTATPLYAPIGWNALFAAVNLFQIGMLIMERRPVFLGEDELRLYNMVFRSLTPREFMKLISIAQYSKADEGQELLKQHQPVNQLTLIARGKGRVEVDGRPVAEVCPGQFVGEMGFLTDQNASASVIASLTVEYLAWPADELKSLFRTNPVLHVKTQGILGVDLVEKLRQEGYATAHPSKVMSGYRKDS